MAPSKVPAGLGKSQQHAVGLEGLIQQSDANTGVDNAGVIPVAADMGGRKKRRRTRRRTRRKTRRKRHKTRRKTRRKTKRKRRRTRRRKK